MSLIITNPDNEEETYEYGKRGRKPLWVQAGEREGRWCAPEKPTSKVSVNARPEGSLRIWQWQGSEEEKSSLRCFIVDENEVGILKNSRKWFKWPISMSELKTFWKEIDEDFSDLFRVDVPGAWQFDEKREEWVAKTLS